MATASGNAFAKHVIREALEFGGSTALSEDNRYFRSTESGFFKRSKHAVASVFVARNDAGGEHFAYSRFGSVLGSSFISRLWQPRSEDSSGDAAVSFGLTMVSDIGWNFFKEFGPRRSRPALRGSLTMRTFIPCFLLAAVLPCAAADSNALLWQEPGKITVADWIWGPGGEARAPQGAIRVPGRRLQWHQSQAQGARRQGRPLDRQVRRRRPQ